MWEEKFKKVMEYVIVTGKMIARTMDVIRGQILRLVPHTHSSICFKRDKAVWRQS